MGERASGLEVASPAPGAAAPAPPPTRESTRELEGDIATLREELGTLVAELDRRRHEVVDVKLQLRRHARGAVLTGVALILAASGIVALGIWRARHRARPLAQARRLGEAVARMVDRPERVAAEPTVPGKILTAAATAAIATVMRKGLEQLWDAALKPPPAPNAVSPEPMEGERPWEAGGDLRRVPASDGQRTGVAHAA